MDKTYLPNVSITKRFCCIVYYVHVQAYKVSRGRIGPLITILCLLSAVVSAFLVSRRLPSHKFHKIFVLPIIYRIT